MPEEIRTLLTELARLSNEVARNTDTLDKVARRLGDLECALDRAA